MRILYYSLILIAFTAFTACNHQTRSSSDSQNTDSLTNSAFTSKQQNKDTFFLKIKGNVPLIVPGKSIGKLKAGAGSQSLKNLGRPQKGDAGMCKSLSRWFYGDSSISPQKELDVFSECDPKDDMRPHIQWIRTTDPAFKTKSGIGTGSTFSEIQSDFDSLKVFATYMAGDSTQMKMLYAPNRGITFEVTSGKPGTCRAVVVYSPEKKLPAMYFTFYRKLKYLNQK